MSIRQDYSNYSSSILISYYKTHTIFDNATKISLNRYRTLYLDYKQKGEDTNPLYWYLFKHGKSLNPIAIYKKMQYRKRIKAIRDIVDELMKLEKTKPLQKILNDISDDYIDIYTEALEDNYITEKQF